MNLLSHVGSDPDQLWFTKHSLWDVPISSYPISQVWFIIDPNVKLLPMVFPFSGVPGSPQSLTKNMARSYNN